MKPSLKRTKKIMAELIAEGFVEAFKDLEGATRYRLTPAGNAQAASNPARKV